MTAHFLDTATDIGLLFEWYDLMQRQKKDSTVEPALDMQSMFYSSLTVVLWYRFISGVCTFFLFFVLMFNFFFNFKK